MRSQRPEGDHLLAQPRRLGRRPAARTSRSCARRCVGREATRPTCRASLGGSRIRRSRVPSPPLASGEAWTWDSGFVWDVCGFGAGGRERWPCRGWAAGAAGCCPALLKPPAPPPLAADVGLPQRVAGRAGDRSAAPARQATRAGGARRGVRRHPRPQSQAASASSARNPAPTAGLARASSAARSAGAASARPRPARPPHAGPVARARTRRLLRRRHPSPARRAGTRPAAERRLGGVRAALTGSARIPAAIVPRRFGSPTRIRAGPDAGPPA